MRGVSNYWYQKQIDSTSQRPIPSGLCGNGQGKKDFLLMSFHSLFINHRRVWQRRAHKKPDKWAYKNWGMRSDLQALTVPGLNPASDMNREALSETLGIMWAAHHLCGCRDLCMSAPWATSTGWGFVSLQLRRSVILKILVTLKENWVCSSLGTYLKVTEHWASFYCCWSPFSSVTTAPRLLLSMQDNSINSTSDQGLTCFVYSTYISDHSLKCCVVLKI